jgi:multiple sugar transport system substrate-binding protein
VAFWFAGERLRSAIRKGLLAPLDAPPLLQAMHDSLGKPLLDATRVGAQTYAMPLSYYPWGFLYRKSQFARWGLSPPATWTEFLALCERLRELGVAPTAVGAQDGWPAAAWFDFLDLRFNGLESHRQTLVNDPGLAGPAAQYVLSLWQGLLRKGYFHPATTGQGWASVLPYLYRGEIGMALLGTFALARVPSALRADIGFFGFPATDLPPFEEAPLDVLVVPAASRQRAEAQALLAFMARSEQLNLLATANGELSPRLDAPPPDDPVLREGRRVLERAAGLSFFFDRDVRQDQVEPAFALFRRLMTPPHDFS